MKDINFKFEDGKTNLIIGQSGSGKTVLMKNLVGLLDPTSGEVLYDGRDFVKMTKEEKVAMRREMGMIFQSAALFDSLSVLENVMFPLDMFSNMNYREKLKRAQECIDRVNLMGAEQKYPGEISGGMQKRVAIARAIVLNPKYLFCDEPNSGLDPKTSLVIDELLSGITKEFDITTIINTHDMNSVIGIGENAHIAFNDPPADFETRESYIVVNLNERCKKQQVGEGWFATEEDVPKQAISMTPYRIMQCRTIVSPVPKAVKAEAISAVLRAETVTPMIPATLMKTHPDFHLFIDRDSAAQCSREVLDRYM